MRTKKIAKNLIVSTILTVLVALIGMIKMKVFIKYLGDESTGIYQLFSQLYSYISLVDAGLTSCLLYCLYKPVEEKDYNKINALLKGGKNFYSKVAILIVIIGIVISFKIDFFLKEYSLPLWYIQLSFIIFIISSAITYLVTPRKVILEAKQNLYKVHFVVYGSIIIKGLLEIFLLIQHYDLLTLMILEFVLAIGQNVTIYFISRKDYPELTYENVTPDTSFKKETKNLIAQKIGSIIFNNIDIILISKFINSQSVVIYSSYVYITNSLQNILKKIGSSSLASVGNLLLSEKNKARNVFYEYNSMCFYIASLVCTPLLLVITPFVSVYYGTEYTLPLLGSILISTILYFKVIEIPLDTFINALGYFGKVKKCVYFQSIVNLVLSIILVFKYEIIGVLIATVISYIVGEFMIYPRILNKSYFKECKLNYYKQSIKLLLISPVSYLALKPLVNIININNLLTWFLTGIVLFILNFLIVTIYYKIIKEDLFFERIKFLIAEKRRKNGQKYNTDSN